MLGPLRRYTVQSHCHTTLQPGPHGYAGHGHLGAALSYVAFCFQRPLFLSTSGKVKHCSHTLLTEPEGKKYRSGKTKR